MIKSDDFTLQVFKIYEAVRFDDEQVRVLDVGDKIQMLTRYVMVWGCNCVQVYMCRVYRHWALV